MGCGFRCECACVYMHVGDEEVELEIFYNS